jgi:hypothetical protein
MAYEVKDRRYYEQRDQRIVDAQVAKEKAAEQSEYAHRANPRRRDDDEMLAMCGIGRGPNLSNPPMRR